MTNAELIATIRNEIERRITDNTFGAKLELIDILAWLDTLESEKPEVDLEKEIETYFKGWYMDETDQGYILHTPDDHAGLMSVKQVARHFYEIGCRRTAEKFDEIEYNRQIAEERQMEKEIPNDLEEAAKVYFENPKNSWQVKDVFIAGAKWQAEKDARDMCMSDNRHFEKVYQLGRTDMREQMLKEAVKGEYDQYPAAIYLPAPLPRMNKGDKVRLIIVKED